MAIGLWHPRDEPIELKVSDHVVIADGNTGSLPL